MMAIMNRLKNASLAAILAATAGGCSFNRAFSRMDPFSECVRRCTDSDIDSVGERGNDAFGVFRRFKLPEECRDECGRSEKKHQ